MAPEPTLHEVQRLHLDGRLEEAEAGYAQLVRAHDPSPEALFLYGTLLLQQDRAPEAVSPLSACVRARPDWAEAHSNLGTAWFQQQRLPEAREAYHRAAMLAPADARVWASLAATYIQAATPREALVYARRALALDPRNASAHWNAALAHLELGEWQAGWAEYGWGFAAGMRTARTYHEGRDTPEWSGAPEQTVVLHGEQGLGDEVLFSGCVPDALRTCRQVILECHPRLEPLFRRSFPEAIVHGTRKEEYLTWPHDHDIDAKLALGTLPRLFRSKESDFPRHAGYLRADEQRAQTLRRELGPAPTIGIAWAGGTPVTRSDLRSIPLAEWSAVFAAAGGARLVSLQYTPGAAEEAARLGLVHRQADIDDLDAQAALIRACDLVISVCQTAVHLAGALHVPTWCLTPAAPAWRYGIAGDGMPWYPSVTLIRQQTSGAWAPALERVAERLRAWLGSPSARFGSGS